MAIDEVLAEFGGIFEPMYSTKGRLTVPPEMLLKATVLIATF